MARRKAPVQPLPYRIYIGDYDHPWDQMAPEEQEAYRDKIAQRLGAASNDYFSRDIGAYQRLVAAGVLRDPEPVAG